MSFDMVLPPFASSAQVDPYTNVSYFFPATGEIAFGCNRMTLKIIWKGLSDMFVLIWSAYMERM